MGFTYDVFDLRAMMAKIKGGHLGIQSCDLCISSLQAGPPRQHMLLQGGR